MFSFLKTHSDKKNVLIIGSGGSLMNYFLERAQSDRVFAGVARSDLFHEQIKHQISLDITRDAHLVISKLQELQYVPDTVIMNAVFTDLGSVLEKDSENFLQELQTGILGPLEIANSLMRQLWIHDGASVNKQRNRSILFVSSSAGVQVYKNEGRATYSATKAGVNMLARHMSEEYSEYGIRVNAVAPEGIMHIPTREKVLKTIDGCIDGPGTGQVLFVSGEDVRCV